MNKIVVYQIESRHRAYIQGRSHCIGEGHTCEEAIGDLIMTWGGVLGLEINLSASIDRNADTVTGRAPVYYTPSHKDHCK